MMEPILLKQHETGHLPLSRVQQAVCTGWYIIPGRIMQLLNIRERFTRFFWTIKGHTCFLGDRERGGYAYKISKTSPRFMSMQSGSPFSFFRQGSERNTSIPQCSGWWQANVCFRIRTLEIYGMLTRQVLVTSQKGHLWSQTVISHRSRCICLLRNPSEMSSRKVMKDEKSQYGEKIFYKCEFLLLLATSEHSLNWEMTKWYMHRIYWRKC